MNLLEKKYLTLFVTDLQQNLFIFHDPCSDINFKNI